MLTLQNVFQNRSFVMRMSPRHGYWDQSVSHRALANKKSWDLAYCFFPQRSRRWRVSQGPAPRQTILIKLDLDGTSTSSLQLQKLLLQVNKRLRCFLCNDSLIASQNEEHSRSFSFLLKHYELWKQWDLLEWQLHSYCLISQHRVLFFGELTTYHY